MKRSFLLALSLLLVAVFSIVTAQDGSLQMVY